MTKEESLAVTALIAEKIAVSAPSVPYTPKDVKEARAAYSDQKIAELQKDGYLGDDFELFYVLCRFLEGMNLWNKLDERYLLALFREARKFDRAAFYADPFLREIEVPEKRIGKHLLLQAFYDRGEFFQYDMPDLDAEIVVPKLGFFPQKVAFPSVYEGNIPWVSVCPSEIASMQSQIRAAHGRVLVLGLGLGYYPFCISKKKEVERITIVERDPEILQLFREHLLPQFSEKEKIVLVQADAFDYLQKLEDGVFDFCFADIWEGWTDGLEAYEKIKPEDERLTGTEFTYWIEKEILWYQRIKKQQG